MMSLGIDFNDIAKVAMQAASTAALGPAGGLLTQQLMSGVGLKVMDQVLQLVGDKLGLPQSQIDMLQSLAHSASGDIAGAKQNAMEAFEGLLNEMSPMDQSRIMSDINKGADDISNQIVKLANETGQQGSEKAEEASCGKKGKGKGNFLEAIATALGEMLGQKAEKMMNSLEQLDSAKGDKAFGRAQAHFSADAQQYGMMSNLTNTVIKTIGEGMNTLAKK